MCEKIDEELIYSKKQFTDEFPQQVIDAISMISYDINNTNVMGSYTSKNLIFAGDIDCAEIIPFNKQAEALQKIVSKITSDYRYGKDFLLGDIKCGDNLYVSCLKYLGKVKNGKIIGYEGKILRKILYDVLYELDVELVDNPTIEEWSKIYKTLNSFVAIRWTPDEILKGSKIVYKNTIDLSLAVYNSSMTKIDLYYNYFGKFTEITNVIFDEFLDKNFFIDQLSTNSLVNYYNGNYLKSLKNAYSYSKITYKLGIDKCLTSHLLNNISKLLVSPINSLNSCISDLDVILNLIKFGANLVYMMNEIKTHIGTIILKLSSYYFTDININVYDILNNIIKEYRIDEIKDDIEKIINYLKNIVINETLKYINDNNLKKYLKNIFP